VDPSQLPASLVSPPHAEPNFGGATPNRVFRHTFQFKLPKNKCCQCTSVTLTLKLKALQDALDINHSAANASNDKWYIYTNGSICASGFVYDQPVPQGTVISKTIKIPCKCLAVSGGYGKLTFVVQDDTSVQSATMTVKGCCVKQQDELGCVQPPAGMVAWYWMDGNAYDTAALGGFNNPSATNAVSFVPGKVGQGVKFGPGGYIEIPSSSALDNQKFTIDAWVQPQGAGPNNDFWGSVIVQKDLPPPAGHTAQSVSLWWSSDQQKFLFGIGTTNPPTNVAVSSNTFPATNTNWYHVAATYDGSTMKLYVNGNLEASKSFTSSITYDSSIPWTIGSTAAPYRALAFPRTFNGVIDEVEIFNRALSQAEIQAIYRRGKCKAQAIDPVPSYPKD